MKNRHELTADGRHVIIYIRCDGVERATIISADDLPRAQAIPTSWYGERRDWTMYARCCFGKPRQYHYLHRWLMRPACENEVDHADHDGLNNTRANLSEVTPTENYDNRRDDCNRWEATAYRWYEKGCQGYYDPDADNADPLDDLPF